MSQQLEATLPESWAEVPFGAYCQLAAATDLPERVRALASLVAVPADLLLTDMRAYAAIRRDTAFLDTLPEAPADFEPVPIHHLGVQYAHVGNLEKINAGQLEALLETLKAHEAAPLLAGPSILALLYCPQGTEQTAEVVRATAAAFETLPMDTAWPALSFFLRISSPGVANFLLSSQLRAQAQGLLSTLESTLLPTGASRPYWRRPLSWLTQRWLKSVAGTLRT